MKGIRNTLSGTSKSKETRDWIFYKEEGWGNRIMKVVNKEGKVRSSEVGCLKEESLRIERKKRLIL